MKYNNYPSDPFGSPAEFASAAQPSRFNQLLNNPDLRQRATEVAHGIGGGAVRGAMEASGVVKYDEQTGEASVSTWGATKAVLMPKRAARKAAVGFVQGGRQAAAQQAQTFRAEATQAVANAYSNADPFGRPAVTQTAENPWSSSPYGSQPNVAPALTYGNAGGGFPNAVPQSPNYGGFPPLSAENPWASPNQPGQDPFGAPAESFPVGPQAYGQLDDGFPPTTPDFGSFPPAAPNMSGGFPAGTEFPR